ncbi:Sps22p NDAI_0A00270 [Naumovozyma dairenensis CBS 421]|uniref:Receptor L-domain domain-containing protein n=1 Tax=Naumovozyma dairenensis (strain ATCC 10597 / BCRC 20456 / CBS 421 / NBRC 0211 / NRRL Y-12639) TaxID=1071378 RepID=G0W5H3_NAUDC|nr:hypothetical protein NDAI_0A00270 [Naumovozyma dairenensis CBS 421]CCD22187.1 hypothetical protein NDAI_0A00270 [Naumovozyma dairenensis CBS 421]
MRLYIINIIGLSLFYSATLVFSTVINHQQPFEVNKKFVKINTNLKPSPHNVVPVDRNHKYKRDFADLDYEENEFKENLNAKQENKDKKRVIKSLVKTNEVIPEICREKEHIIGNVQALSALQSQCEEIQGSLKFSDFNGPIVDLGNIKIIHGDMIIEDVNDLVQFQAPNLITIDGNFVLKSLTSLVHIEIPNLILAKSLDWKIIPILNSLEMNNNLESVNKIYIISDTSLTNLDSFSKVDDVEIFNINNNRFLETIKANIKVVSKQLSIHANSKELELEMPYLKTVENITIRDTTSIWLPSLEYIDSSMEFIENYFTDLKIPTLKYIGGTLGIIANNKLTNVDFNNVTNIEGGLMIENNLNLERIDFLDSLKLIGGAIHFEGKFKEIKFENLKLVKGSAFIKSSSDSLNCNQWLTPVNGRSIIRGGKIKCTSGRKFNTINLDEDGAIIPGNDNENGEEFDDNTENVGTKGGENPFSIKNKRKKHSKKARKGVKVTNSGSKFGTSLRLRIHLIILVCLGFVTLSPF